MNDNFQDRMAASMEKVYKASKPKFPWVQCGRWALLVAFWGFAFSEFRNSPAHAFASVALYFGIPFIGFVLLEVIWRLIDRVFAAQDNWP